MKRDAALGEYEADGVDEVSTLTFGDLYWRHGIARAAGEAEASSSDTGIGYRELIDNLPTLSWVADVDGQVLWCNRRWHDYCGSTPDDTDHDGWQSFYEPAALPQVTERWASARATGEPFETVCSLRGADGVYRPFLTRVVPLRDAGGRVCRWIGNNVDVSRQSAVEQELRRSREELERVNRTLAEREAFLLSVLSSSTDCIKVIDLDARLTFMSEGGMRVMEISDFNAVAGCPWPQFWQGAGHAAAHAAVEAARRGEATSFIGKADTYLGTPKWWHVAVSPIAGLDGAPDRILSVSRDITALRDSEEERDHFVRLVENSNDFVSMARTDGAVFYLNDAARQLVGLEDANVDGLTIGDFFPPDQVATVLEEVLPTVTREGQWMGELNFRHFVTGELIPVLYSAFPITDSEGQLIGYGTVTRDDRQRKAAEEAMRLLNGELAHRLKNVLAVVQAVAQQTLRNTTDIATASQVLAARLSALGNATDVLTNRSWRSADLRYLAESALSPHGVLGERIHVEGPSVTLRPEVTVALALALHELATNAAKYGALSNDQGTVTLSWTLAGKGKAARLALIWRERGGPRVAPPQRKGFGSTLIERSLRLSFGGMAETLYCPDGLVFRLDAPLADAVIPDAV
jgi:PAS domain S-box-containing protein